MQNCLMLIFTYGLWFLNCLENIVLLAEPKAATLEIFHDSEAENAIIHFVSWCMTLTKRGKSASLKYD
jgi:hypothetical protein